jgi:hypothetical protein
MRRAADLRARTVIAVHADRCELALAELHRTGWRVARNGKTSGASNDMQHANVAEAHRRAAMAEREAALWRATAEVLRLDRDIYRGQTQRAMRWNA